MGNWFYHTLSGTGVGTAYQAHAFALNTDHFDEIYVADADHLAFDTKGRPAYAVVSRISKDILPGTDLCLTLTDDGNLFLTRQLLFRDGTIRCIRHRLGEETDPYTPWEMVPAPESQMFLAKAFALEADRR